MIHVAILTFTGDPPGQQVYASLDGESYLPCSRMPEPGEEELIGDLFKPDPDTRMQYMRYARRALDPFWWPEGFVTEAEHLTIE